MKRYIKVKGSVSLNIILCRIAEIGFKKLRVQNAECRVRERHGKKFISLCRRGAAQTTLVRLAPPASAECRVGERQTASPYGRGGTEGDGEGFRRN